MVRSQAFGQTRVKHSYPYILKSALICLEKSIAAQSNGGDNINEQLERGAYNMLIRLEQWVCIRRLQGIIELQAAEK